MAYALFPNASIERPLRERAWITVAASVLLHVAVGWAVISLLVVRTIPEPDQPTVIEMAPPMALPAPAAPSITPDEREALPMPERSELAIPKPDTPPTPPHPPTNAGSVGAPGSNGVGAGPVGPPMAAPRPTYRAPVVFPRRAQVAEREGVAVVEVLIAVGGGVSDIRLVSETPGGYGFGDAALKSVANWRFDTAQPGVYRVTVNFRME
jgi:protein TonB